MLEALIAVTVSAVIRATPEYAASTESRYDSVNEGSAEYFFRERFSVDCEGRGEACLSPTFAAAITTTYRTEEKRQTSTWFARVSNDKVAFIVGDFHAPYGIGLLAGHRQPWNPDPFAENSNEYAAEGFVPVTSGEAGRSFHGAGFSLRTSGELISFGLDAYGSRALRFVAMEDLSTESSLGGILDKPIPEGSSQTPVTVRSGGGSFGMRMFDMITLGAGIMGADLQTSSGQTVSWSRWNEGETVRSYSGLCGYSFFSSYNDGMIKASAEWAFVRNSRMEDGEKISKESASARRIDVTIDAEKIRCAVKGKIIQPGYYSPYMTIFGGTSPSEGVFAELTYRPLEYLSAVIGNSCEKRYLPDNFRPDIVPGFKEWAALKIGQKPITAALSWKGLHNKSGEAPERNQYKASVEISPVRVISLSSGVSVQKNGTRMGRVIEAGVSLTKKIFFNGIQLLPGVSFGKRIGISNSSCA